MATLILGGLASLLGAGSLVTWGIPAALIGGLVVSTMGGNLVGFGIRQLVFQPLMLVAAAVLPWPVRLAVSTADLCFSGVLLVVGTARASYHGARLVAGAAYLVVAGLVTGTVLVVRFARRESAQQTADRVHCLATTTDAKPTVTLVDDSAPQRSAASLTARSLLASGSALALTTTTTTAATSTITTTAATSTTTTTAATSTITTAAPSTTVAASTSANRSPFEPLLDASSALPSDSIADLSVVLSSLPSASADLASAASLTAAASALYPELSMLQPEVEFDEFARASMSAAAQPQDQLQQEAVAQCSLAGLSKLLASYADGDIAEIAVYESTDAELARPVRSLTVDELKQMVASAQLSLAANSVVVAGN